MIVDARISILADFDSDNLSDLRRFDQPDLQLFYESLEDFVADGNTDEFRAMHSEAPEFVDPLPGLADHPDHVEIRQALRRAAEVYNKGYQDAQFAVQIDLDETFGPAGSEADPPRPTCVRESWIDGELVVEYNWALSTFDEDDEPADAAFDVDDVLDDTTDEEDPLVGLGVRDNEVEYRILLRYRFVEGEAQESA